MLLGAVGAVLDLRSVRSRETALATASVSAGTAGAEVLPPSAGQGQRQRETCHRQIHPIFVADAAHHPLASPLIAEVLGDASRAWLPVTALAGEAAHAVDRADVRDGQTCSIGVCRWQPAQSVEQVVAEADAALYRAKRQGRDQTVLSSPAPLTRSGANC